MAWILAHLGALSGIVTGILGVIAAIFALAGNSAAVARIEALESAISKVVPPSG